MTSGMARARMGMERRVGLTHRAQRREKAEREATNECGRSGRVIYVAQEGTTTPPPPRARAGQKRGARRGSAIDVTCEMRCDRACERCGPNGCGAGGR
jgi:hypothetical protein